MSSLVYSLRGRLRRVEQEKLWTYIITSLLILGLYIFLQQIVLPEPRFDVEKFKEIDFTRFQPPKPKTETAEKKPEERAPDEPAPDQVAPTEIPEIDLSQLNDLAKLQQEMPDLNALGRIASAPQSVQLPEVNVGTNKMPPINAPVVAVAPGGLPVFGTPSNKYDPSLKADKVGYGGTPGKTLTSGREGKLTDRPTNKISEQVKVQNFNSEQVDFNKVFRELLEWMKMNPAELPATLKHYLRYKPGDITSYVSIAVPPSGYDLYILANEQSQDIGLLLVVQDDSSNAILLRDTGFRKKSFYLSKGVAGRDEADNGVISVSMLEDRPTKGETTRFYDIFLSWWDKNKPDQEKKP